MKILRLAALAALIALGAQPCFAKRAYNYSCGDGTRLTAAFSGTSSSRSSAIINFVRPRVRLVLPQAMSADGGRYSDGKTEFWIKGTGATLTRPNRPPTSCNTPSP